MDQKKADHRQFYEVRFDLKGTFPTELANIVESIKNILNHSDVIDTPFSLEDLLTGTKTEREELSRLTLAQDISCITIVI